MTSFGHKDASVQGWNPSARIQGQIYHQLGSLMPPEDRRARYIQVYFLDTLEDQLRARGEHQNLNVDILERITAWLNENNHYMRELKTALEQVRQGNINDKKILIWENKRAQGEHARRFNAPTGAEVAILMSNEPTENRDIVLQLKQGGLRRISELHRPYDPLMYPLFFPYGTDGYHIYLQGRNGRKVTQLQFYSFHIMCREGNYLLLGRRLFQQFLVDAYCKIETERLKFWRREQQSLRAENYSDLRDSLLAADGDPNQVGRRIVLPATYTGGPRYLHEKRSDAMAFVRHYGTADYFITMTCNPRWPEIVDNSAPGQESHDRPDIVARVFRLKVKKFMEHMKKGIFGTLQAWL
ncbi:putative Helitron helicase-like domain at N-terminus-containing protein 2 [Homarus americanus]|uniref:Putative Helitron helicase-like domain at N-terminus-containing protein 2 n=1 Tax=Homarus americanus TaxID=6706 RepID=A0A8J5NB98_HOMAM|nr:putative Helitron helicase-like domain at N-terminus-containing protein 2 [Homarus americanus]